MLVACATDDEILFTKNHFGDALQYNLYDVKKEQISLISSIMNSTEEEFNIHANPKKAKAILELLHTRGAELLVNRAFGPNIKVINKFVLPVIYRGEQIIDALTFVQRNHDEIKNIVDNKSNCYISIKDRQIQLVESK